MNASNALSSNFGQQQQMLMSQLGLQGLQRADQATLNALAARGQQAGLLGQQAGLLGQQAGISQAQAGLAQQQFGNIQAGVGSRNQAEEARLQALTAGIQNASLPLALQTANTAAEKAGESQNSGGGKK
jgi:hypothetical protein